jgi:hypothetical protein
MDEEKKPLSVDEAVALARAVLDCVADEDKCQVMAQLRRVYGG